MAVWRARLAERKRRGEEEWDQLEAARRQRYQKAWEIISVPARLTIQFLTRTKLSQMATVGVGIAWTIAVLLGSLLFREGVPLGRDSMVCIHESCIRLDFVMLGFWIFTLVGFLGEQQKIVRIGWIETLNQWMFRIVYVVLLVGIRIFVMFLWSC